MGLKRSDTYSSSWRDQHGEVEVLSYSKEVEVTATREVALRNQDGSYDRRQSVDVTDNLGGTLSTTLGRVERSL